MKFDHVFTSLDHGVKDIRSEYQDRKRELEIADTDPTKKTLLYVYYSGHGVIIRGTTHIVLNEADAFSHRYFPLERYLKVLKGFHNTYIVGVFDCCREAITIPTRGDDDGANDNEVRGSVYLTFGCAADTGVKANSTLAKNYRKCLQEILNKAGGVLSLNGLSNLIEERKMEPNSECLPKV